MPGIRTSRSKVWAHFAEKQMGQVSPTLNHTHASHTPTTQIINTTSQAE